MIRNSTGITKSLKVSKFKEKLKDAGIYKAFASYRDLSGKLNTIVYEKEEFYRFSVENRSVNKLTPVEVYDIIILLKNRTYTIRAFGQFKNQINRGDIQ